MSAVPDIVSALLVVAGAFFCVVGGIGMLRMPDLYTRMHAVSVIETLGAYLLLAGFMIEAGFTLVSAKLAMVGVLFFFAAPAATHALARAAFTHGVAPQLAAREEAPSKP